ncbi:type IV secretion system protein VirB7 [Bartonella sp. B10]
MKLRITVVAILVIALTGCASLRGTKKPPRCNGRHTRILNQDKWDWNNKNVILQQKVIKPVATPVILNTLEHEKQTTGVAFNASSLNPVSHEKLSSKTTEAVREK